jgi:2-polyprenyl-3-methyl-5-hydroxy-6-metoxy-1,4-benzoquinol methylase
MPSPEIIFDALFAYERSAALKSAIDLDVFTAIDQGARTASAIAEKTRAAERGIRILCDYLTVHHLLEKSGDAYALVPESAAFLSRQSPAYLGTTASFLTRPELNRNFDHLTDAVRQGGVAAGQNMIEGENPLWVEFARSMMPMMVPNAHAIADAIDAAGAGPIKVLDLAAGHGIFGITIAQRNPRAEIVAVDWKSVLTVARENASAFGVAPRYSTIEGDAFTVEFGDGFDVALVTNFLHHFDAATNTRFLKKVRAALRPGGRVVVLEFVPNPDRVSPPIPAGFSLTMLAGTARGEAYTADELTRMLNDAGFTRVQTHRTSTPQTILIAERA